MGRDGISPAAGVLLLDLLEQADPILSAVALADHFPGPGRELIGHGLIQPYGTDEVAISDDGEGDVPVAVIGFPSGDDTGYFSAASGWLGISTDQLRRFRVDISAAMAAVARLLAWSRPMRPAALVEEDLWEVGEARIARGPLTSVWFARRLWEERQRKALSSYAARRPAQSPRVVLTSSPFPDIETFRCPGHLVVSIRDVIASGSGLAIDPTILAARFSGLGGAAISEIVYLTPDGRTLFIHGKEVITVSGPRQMKIINLLATAYREGRRRSTAKLLEEAGSESGSLPRAFGKKWRLLHAHLEYKDREWGLAP